MCEKIELMAADPSKAEAPDPYIAPVNRQRLTQSGCSSRNKFAVEVMLQLGATNLPAGPVIL
jgi:hypothetical protein